MHGWLIHDLQVKGTQQHKMKRQGKGLHQQKPIRFENAVNKTRTPQNTIDNNFDQHPLMQKPCLQFWLPSQSCTSLIQY